MSDLNSDQMDEEAPRKIFPVYSSVIPSVFPSSAPPVEIGMKCHSRFEPDCNSLEQTRKMKQTFSAPSGGVVDQSYLYADSISAEEWCGLANQKDYVANYIGHLPLEWAAQLIVHHLQTTRYKQDTVDIVGLGGGDGKKEATLIRHLLEYKSIKHINCYMVDTSPALIIEAHKHLTESFSDRPEVEIKEAVSNFLHLPRYPLFCEPEDPNIMRVCCMFGGTFGNLHDELYFVRHSLRILKPGDLFLLDVLLKFAPTDEPDKIQHEDPRLRGEWQSATHSWLESTLRRYRKHTQRVSFQNVLKFNSSLIPDTYTIEVQVNVDNQAQFSMLQYNRYDLDSFAGTIKKEGWKGFGGRTFGSRKKWLLYLFGKE